MVYSADTKAVTTPAFAPNRFVSSSATVSTSSSRMRFTSRMPTSINPSPSMDTSQMPEMPYR